MEGGTKKQLKNKNKNKTKEATRNRTDDLKHRGYISNFIACHINVCAINDWLQCTPHAWDTTLGHDTVETIIILSQFWGDRKFILHLKMLQPRWLKFNTKFGWCFACPRFAAQMPEYGSLGQSIISTVLSHPLVKTQAKMSHKDTIRYS